jgi:tRNA threonylcarbamoyladenosine biosynthesis protein TsaE
LNIYLPDNAATVRFGQAFADAIASRAVVALSGPLGAGKTTFVQAVALGLGVKEIVNSPTFTMLNEYHSGRIPVYHMDLYRLSEAKDAAQPLDLLLAELDEMMTGSMVALIEWAELLEESGCDYLAQLDHVVINLNYINSKQDEQSAEKFLNSPSYYARARTRAEVGGNASYIKEEIGRTASLVGHGAHSEDLLMRLGKNITDMLIYS